VETRKEAMRIARDFIHFFGTPTEP